MAQHLTPSAILEAWEIGTNRRPLDRALALLWASGASDDPASLPLADRDRALMHLHTATFGREIEVQAVCPSCQEMLEFSLDPTELVGGLPTLTNETIGKGEAQVTLRALTSRDLAAVADLPPEEVPAAMRARATGLDAVPPDIAAKVDARLDAREAEGELHTKLRCPACSRSWTETLDFVALIWPEVDAAARQLLGDVADLARAFGWTERDVLALSPARRQAYLRLAWEQ